MPDPLTQSIEEEEQEEEQEREEDFLWDPEELSLPERPGFTEADIITISSPPAPAAPAPAPPVSSQIEMPQQMAEDTASDSGCTMEEFIAQLKEAAKEPCEHDVCFFDGFVPGTKDYAFRCRGCGHRFVLKLARYKYPHVRFRLLQFVHKLTMTRLMRSKRRSRNLARRPNSRHWENSLTSLPDYEYDISSSSSSFFHFFVARSQGLKVSFA